MCLKMFVILVILKTTIAYHPVTFQKDKLFIATEPMNVQLSKNKIENPDNYPYYEVVPNPNIIIPTKSPPVSLDTENIPADLIEIAETKLGITSLDQIPSLSELSNVLGTTSREETIETIRELAATESGIDLIKAFIESLDYGKSTTAKNDNIQTQSDTFKPSVPTILSETTRKDLNITKPNLATPEKELGFFQRICSYLNFFDLFPENKDISISVGENEVDYIKDFSKHNESHNQHHPKLQPISVANRFSNSIPVSYRSGASSSTFPISTHRVMKEDRHFPEVKILH